MNMKKLTTLVIFLFSLVPLTAQEINTDGLDKLGWKLAVQSYSFKNFTFSQTLEFCNELGLKYVEAFPFQKIGAGIDGNMHYSMSPDTRKKVKELLVKHGPKLINYGVANCQNAKQWNDLFSFSSDMGIGTILSEPQAEQMD